MRDLLTEALRRDFPERAASAERAQRVLVASGVTHVARSFIDVSRFERIFWLAARLKPSLIQVAKDSKLREIPRGWDGLVFASQMLREGHTIAVNFAEEVDPDIAELVRMVGCHFGGMAYASIFLTPAGSHCFLPHSDGIDVLALQLEGSKHWHLRDGATSWARHKHSELHPIEKDEARFEASHELLPGHALYVPRGELHYVETKGAAHSLHVSVGIHTPRRYEVLREALTMMSDSCTYLRENTSHIPDVGSAAVLAERDQLESLLTRKLWNPDVVRRAANRIRAQKYSALPQLPNSHFASAITDAQGRIDSSTRLRRRPGMPCEVLVLASDLVGISFPGLTHDPGVSEEPVLTAPMSALPVFRHIAASTSEFVPLDLPGLLDAEGRATVCRVLVEKGLLEIADTASVHDRLEQRESREHS